MSATQVLPLLLRELDDSGKVLAMLLPLVDDSNLVSCNHVAMLMLTLSEASLIF
jgi:hypothetical protein